MNAADEIEIVDGQVHVGRVNTSQSVHDEPGIPHTPDGPMPVKAALVAMDAVGVRAAVVDVWDGVAHKPGDQDYGAEVARMYPERIATMRWIDHLANNVEDLVAGARARPGTLATRVVIHDWDAFAHGAYERFFSAAEKHDLPMFAMVTDRLDLALEIPRRHPDVLFVIDHLGLPQHRGQELQQLGRREVRAMDDPPFLKLDQLLAFAKFPNVAVKFCGAPTYSREPYPFRDLWPHLHRIIEAFRPERLIWASDVTRLRRQFNYAELLGFLRYTAELGDNDKALILGGSLRRLLRWPKAEQGAVGETMRPAKKRQ